MKIEPLSQAYSDDLRSSFGWGRLKCEIWLLQNYEAAVKLWLCCTLVERVLFPAGYDEDRRYLDGFFVFRFFKFFWSTKIWRIFCHCNKNCGSTELKKASRSRFRPHHTDSCHKFRFVRGTTIVLGSSKQIWCLPSAYIRLFEFPNRGFQFLKDVFFPKKGVWDVFFQNRISRFLTSSARTIVSVKTKREILFCGSGFFIERFGKGCTPLSAVECKAFLLLKKLLRSSEYHFAFWPMRILLKA